jgi:hypothetical protein
MKKKYAAVEKPERIMRHQTAPRPEDIVPDIEAAIEAGDVEIEEVEETETSKATPRGVGGAVALKYNRGS